MWIAFRLVLALVGFAIRVARRRTKFDPTGEVDDVPYRVKVRRRRWGIVGFSLRMPRRSPTWLRMHSESALDHADLVIGPGRWSLPCYREITVGNKTWSATL